MCFYFPALKRLRSWAKKPKVWALWPLRPCHGPVVSMFGARPPLSWAPRNSEIRPKPRGFVRIKILKKSTQNTGCMYVLCILYGQTDGWMDWWMYSNVCLYLWMDVCVPEIVTLWYVSVYFLWSFQAYSFFICHFDLSIYIFKGILWLLSRCFRVKKTGVYWRCRRACGEANKNGRHSEAARRGWYRVTKRQSLQVCYTRFSRCDAKQEHGKDNKFSTQR